jgi:hypothetical protein
MKTMTRSIALVTGILALRLCLAQAPAAAPAGATGEKPFQRNQKRRSAGHGRAALSFFFGLPASSPG